MIFATSFAFTFSQINPVLGIYPLDSCDFDSSCSMIVIDSSAGNIWQIATPAKPFFDTASSPPNAILTDSVNPYATNNNSTFEWHVANGTGLSLVVEFKHKLQTDSAVDGGYIEVSYDHGTSWKNVITEDTATNIAEFNMENMYGHTDYLANGEAGFSGTIGDTSTWVTTKLQWIWAWPVKKAWVDTLYLRFHFYSDSVQDSLDGWMIDDLVESYTELGGSIDEGIGKIPMKVFPNPAQEIAIVEFENPRREELELQIFDYMGKLLRQESGISSESVEVHRENLSPGIYHLVLLNKDAIVSHGKLLIADDR